MVFTFASKFFKKLRFLHGELVGKQLLTFSSLHSELVGKQLVTFSSLHCELVGKQLLTFSLSFEISHIA